MAKVALLVKIANKLGININPATEESVAPLGGTGVNGQRELTLADTWYAVPSTVPTEPYQLSVAPETAVGQMRWGFDNDGAPSATNGNKFDSRIDVVMKGGEVLYIASDTVLDTVNWTTKEIT